MSATVPRTWKRAHLSAIAGLLRKAITASGKLLMQAAQSFAEARIHGKAIEAELYQHRYKHSSKNDDDLPIVR